MSLPFTLLGARGCFHGSLEGRGCLNVPSRRLEAAWLDGSTKAVSCGDGPGGGREEPALSWLLGPVEETERVSGGPARKCEG